MRSEVTLALIFLMVALGRLAVSPWDGLFDPLPAVPDRLSLLGAIAGGLIGLLAVVQWPYGIRTADEIAIAALAVYGAVPMSLSVPLVFANLALLGWIYHIRGPTWRRGRKPPRRWR